MSMSNFHVVLAKRTGVNNIPKVDDFRYESCLYPALPDNGVIVKTTYLSTDPAMRCRLNDDTGVDYVTPFEVGDTIDGFGGEGVIVESNSPDYQPGDVVGMTSGLWPWKLYIPVDLSSQAPFALQLQKVDVSSGMPNHRLLTCYPIVGLTAILGVREKGHVTPGANQTMVVSGAAGACGSLAGQIARIDGCSRVVGICGSVEKCQFLVNELKFDAAINYKTQDVASELKSQCPNGIDIYFDNVGGDLSDIVIRQMTQNSHVILCGQISKYNEDLPYPPPLSAEIEKLLKQQNIARDRFLVLGYQEKFSSSLSQLAQWLMEGKLHVRESITEGLENAGRAFVSMMEGGNIGKQLVHVAD